MNMVDANNALDEIENPSSRIEDHSGATNRILERSFCSTEFGNIHYRYNLNYNPELTPLMCLHMSPLSGRSFERLIRSPSNQRQMIAIDYPGYGDSDPSSIIRPLLIQDYAKVAWDVLDDLGILNTHLFGHHTGSKVAVEMAIQRSKNVQSIILAAASVNKSVHDTPNMTVDQLDEDGTHFTTLWMLMRGCAGPGTSLDISANMFLDALKAGDRYKAAMLAAHLYNGVFEKNLSQLDHEITLINLDDELKTVTPAAIKYIKNGTLLERMQWGHGFLEAHAEDVLAELELILDTSLI